MEWLKIQKLEYLENRTCFFYKVTSHNAMFGGRGGNVSIHCGGVFFRQGDTLIFELILSILNILFSLVKHRTD